MSTSKQRESVLEMHYENVEFQNLKSKVIPCKQFEYTTNIAQTNIGEHANTEDDHNGFSTERKYTLRNLFTLCANNPDSIINKFKNCSNGHKCLPLLDISLNESVEDSPKLEWENVGEKKYHYLMVDAATSSPKLSIYQHRSVQTQFEIMGSTHREMLEIDKKHNNRSVYDQLNDEPPKPSITSTISRNIQTQHSQRTNVEKQISNTNDTSSSFLEEVMENKSDYIGLLDGQLERNETESQNTMKDDSKPVNDVIMKYPVWRKFLNLKNARVKKCPKRIMLQDTDQFIATP